MESRLGELRCPIMGFWGQNDRFTPMSGYAKFIEACPDCSFTLVANCGHWVMVERERMFNAQLTAFLEPPRGRVRRGQSSPQGRPARFRKVHDDFKSGLCFAKRRQIRHRGKNSARTVIGDHGASPSDGAVGLKIDEHPFRMPDRARRGRQACRDRLGDGVERRVRGDAVKTLQPEGVALRPGTPEEASRRCVTDFFATNDPAGNPIEFYYGRTNCGEAFRLASRRVGLCHRERWAWATSSFPLRKHSRRRYEFYTRSARPGR